MMKHWTTRGDRSQRRSQGTKTKSGALFAVLLIGLSACSSGATSPKEVRKLAGSNQAVQARQKTEKRLREVVHAYADRTPLTLRLIVVRDICQGGSGKQWFFQDGSDTYKIKCSMRITAYYGADPHRIGDVLDGILTAGDHDKSQPGAPGAVIPFTHDDDHRKLVDYYRGHGPNPNGPHALEPTQLIGPGQTLAWDSVHDHTQLVEEPPGGVDNDPPVTRFQHEPESETVASIRKQYGMVFKLELNSNDYYKVFKSGQTDTK